MSGVEIAGLILGGFPIVIHTLERYSEGVQSVKRFFRYRREFRSLIRRLGLEVEIFRNICEELLNGLVPADQIVDMLDTPGGSAWSDPRVGQLLKRRLRRSYTGYLSTVKDMILAVEEFKIRLKVKEVGEMPSENHAIFRQMYERFRFSINRDDYADLMQRIKEGNNYLKRLTSQNLRLEPARTSQHTWTPQRFDLIRGYASSLVSALRSGFCCSCQAPHSINLMLESRYEKPYQKFEQIDEQITFSVTFGYGYRNNISNSVPWLWKRASIQLAHVEEVATTETATSTAKLEISNSLVSNDRLSRKPKKLARFSITEVNEDHSSCNVTPPRPPGVELISDLCTSIVQKSLEKNSLDRPVGYLFDKSRACKYVVHPLDSASISSFSLRQAMLESVPGQFAPMRMSARKTLAMTLASSVLQLYGTPWLPAKWKSDDILFIHAQDLRPHLAPHVSTLVTPEMTEAPSKSPATSPKKGFMSPNIRDEVTFGLGILLIELCLGKPIDQLRTPSDLNPDGSEHVTTDFRTATRLLDDIYEEAGGRYGDAVRRCIYCEFDQRKTTLEDPLFRRAVYQGVVCPLEEDLAEFHCLS